MHPHMKTIMYLSAVVLKMNRARSAMINDNLPIEVRTLETGIRAPHNVRAGLSMIHEALNSPRQCNPTGEGHHRETVTCSDPDQETVEVDHRYKKEEGISLPP